MDHRETVEAVARMQVLIHARLCERITLKQLASAAGYSPYHSARMFRELTGKTPFDYIRALRLSRAALRLRDEGGRVLDVALDFVFDSHEGFTRAFSRQFGLPPKRYSRQTPPIPLFMPSNVREDYNARIKGEANMEQAKMIFVQPMERPARKALIKRGVKATHYFEYCEEMGCDGPWPLLCSVKEALYEPVGMWLPRWAVAPGTSLYVHGVELPTDYANVVPEGFELIDLPPCAMLVFQGPPYDDEDYQAEVGAVMCAVDAYNPGLHGYEWAPEDGPRFQLAPMGYRGYIEARPVRPLQAK